MLELEKPSKNAVASSWLRNTAMQPCSSARLLAISCRRLSSGNAAPGQPIHVVLNCPSGSPSSAATSPPEDLVTRSSSTVTGKRLETLMRVFGIGIVSRVAPACEITDNTPNVFPHRDFLDRPCQTQR